MSIRRELKSFGDFSRRNRCVISAFDRAVSVDTKIGIGLIVLREPGSVRLKPLSAAPWVAMLLCRFSAAKAEQKPHSENAHF